MNTETMEAQQIDRLHMYDGGPAFPRERSIHRMFSPEEGFTHDQPQEGMSLRDWFAGQALAGLSVTDPAGQAQHLAQWAYQCADAMLAKRLSHLTSGQPTTTP